MNKAAPLKTLQRRRKGIVSWRGATTAQLSFASSLDYLMIFLGTACTIVHGAGFPLLSLILGGMTTVFLQAQNSAFGDNSMSSDNSSGLPAITRYEGRKKYLTEKSFTPRSSPTASTTSPWASSCSSLPTCRSLPSQSRQSDRLLRISGRANRAPPATGIPQVHPPAAD